MILRVTQYHPVYVASIALFVMTHANPLRMWFVRDFLVRCWLLDWCILWYCWTWPVDAGSVQERDAWVTQVDGIVREAPNAHTVQEEEKEVRIAVDLGARFRQRKPKTLWYGIGPHVSIRKRVIRPCVIATWRVHGWIFLLQVEVVLVEWHKCSLE